MKTIHVRLIIEMENYIDDTFVRKLCDTIINDFKNSETKVEKEKGTDEYDFYGSPEDIYKVIKHIKKITNAVDELNSLSFIEDYYPKYILLRLRGIDSEVELKRQMFYDEWVH